MTSEKKSIILVRARNNRGQQCFFCLVFTVLYKCVCLFWRRLSVMVYASFALYNNSFLFICSPRIGRMGEDERYERNVSRPGHEVVVWLTFVNCTRLESYIDTLDVRLLLSQRTYSVALVSVCVQEIVFFCYFIP